MIASFAVLIAALFSLANGHSTMSAPQPTASRPCRLGGDPAKDLESCPGPCDLRPLETHYPNMTGPNNPSAIYSRGQQVTIKYQRNNHGPGGFIRLTLVPVDQMMNKNVHEKNAFHYGCWGANPVVATASERRRNAQGFSVAGADGKLHGMPVSYYTTKVKIPAVVPDGVYALGWVWYGGLGGTIYQNVPTNPYPRGLFSDYWSCAFVRIQGGSPMEQEFQPVFESDMERWWGDACKAANDAPGVCTYEPCIVNAKMQKPRPFKGGAKPKVIRPRDFLGTRSGVEPQIPPMVPESQVINDALAEIFEWKRKALRRSDEQQLST